MIKKLFLILLCLGTTVPAKLNDTDTTLAEIKIILAKFNKEREWDKTNTPKDLSMALAIEAAELMELFLRMTDQESWNAMDENSQRIAEEAADVLIYLLCFCNATGLDISKAVEDKIALNAKKYPVEKCKGRRVKYTEL